MSYRVPQQRAGYVPKGLHQRDEEYEEDNYDEYEEEASENEEDEEPEPPKPTKEEQDFLKLREKLKNRFREKIRKQSAKTSSHSSESRDTKTLKNNAFGSFFGPSKPVIASRVIEESRSIRETKHIMANMPASKKRDSTVSGVKTESYQHRQQPKVINEVKKKAQTLKDMRDYSFLLSDDADIPTAKEQPAPRNPSTPKSDGPSAQSSLKSKTPIGNPTRLSSSGSELKKSASSKPHMQTKPVHAKEAPIKRPMPASAESRKLPTGASGNRPIKPTGNNALPQKVPPQNMSMNKPVRKAMEESSLKKSIQHLKPHSSGIKHEVDQKRLAHSLDRQKTVKPPIPSTKAQPSRQNLSRGPHGPHADDLRRRPHVDDSRRRPPKRNLSDDDSKQNLSRGSRGPHADDLRRRPHVDDSRRRPPKRNLSDEEDVDFRSVIRGMFGYNPNKYAGMDEDDSDMEADFATIQKEERRSAKIARQEDEEQLRLIEEEEECERQCRMKKLKRG